jgi:hypothetical protein
MSQVIKARVISGRYSGQVVRVTNVSLDSAGKKKAAVFLEDGSRANIDAIDLEVIPPEVPKPEPIRPKIAMPFMSGSTGSRSLNQTKSLEKKRPEHRPQSTHVNMQMCEKCGEMYDLEKRKGMPGKITECEECALETEVKVEGSMIFSHKTGATIEIKKDGELIHEAEIFDPKNKT